MRLLLFFLSIILLLNRCSSNVDSVFQIQPQSVLINNFDERYITNDDHYIGQVLYRYDRIELSCDCQTSFNQTDYYIYWRINNQILNQLNNSNNLQLSIDIDTVQVPITYVTCSCVFILINSTRIRRDYQYQLYIDLESHPSLEPIQYFVRSSVIKEHFYSFIQHHFLIIPSFILIIIGITCPLMILSIVRS